MLFTHSSTASKTHYMDTYTYTHNNVESVRNSQQFRAFGRN